jgi:predicted ATP-grasp superfamily ATP-dependent carboligase
VEFLKQQAAVLEGQLKAVKEQLKALQQEERQDKARDPENEDL